MDDIDGLALDFKAEEERDDESISVDIDDVKINNIPPIDELRNRGDDLKTTELLDFIDRYQQKIVILRATIAKINLDKREKSRQHRGSVIDLHNLMFARLLNQNEDAKAEADVLKDRVIELQTDIAKKDIVTGLNIEDSDTHNASKLSKLMDENIAKDAKIKDLQQQLAEQKRLLKAERMNSEKAANSDRESVITLHNNIFKKLLDAEAD